MESYVKTRYPNKPTRLLIDITSQTVLCHVNHLFRQLVPQWYMQGYMKRSREGVLNAFKFESVPKRGILVGSFVDGFTIPDVKLRDIAGTKLEDFGQNFDLDMLLMSDLTAGHKFGECDGIIDTTHTYPGYFRVVSTGQETFSLLQDVEEDFIGTKYERHGPAVMITTMGIGFDMVPTGRCSSWPEEALPWVYRTSLTGWPSWKTKQEIIHNRCHFVQKAHASSSDPSSEFRFSFVFAEKLLISRMTTPQKQCFIIFKTLVKYVISPDSPISSYCLKTTLFWTLERVPKSVWEDKIHGTAVCFLQLLDTLIQFLCEGNIPQYFIPENNLLSHVDKAVLTTDMQRLVHLRKQPVEVLLEYDNIYCLPTSIHGFMDEIPKLWRRATANYKVSNCNQEDIEECTKLHHDDAMDCFSHMAKLKSISGAIGIMHSIRLYEMMLGFHEKDLVRFVHDYIQEHKHKLSMNRMEFLAVLCSIAFLQENSKIHHPPKNDLVDAAFLGILDLKESSSCQFLLHFLMYLIHCEQAETAYFIFQAVEEVFVQAEQFCDFEYQRNYVGILDEVLSLLYRENPMSKFPCNVIYYYMYVSVCVKLDLLEEAQQKMSILEEICPIELRDPMDISFKLEAFTLMTVGSFWDAAEAFEKDVYHRQELYNCAGVDEDIASSLLQIESGDRASICRCMTLYLLHQILD